MPTEWEEEIITKTIKKAPDAERMIGIRIHSGKKGEGPIIGSVYADTPCADAELKKGMRVIRVNGKDVDGKEAV